MTRAKKKRVKKELDARKKAANTSKEVDSIQTNLVAVEDAHSRRPRCAYFGEMEQMDAPMNGSPDRSGSSISRLTTPPVELPAPGLTRRKP